MKIGVNIGKKHFAILLSLVLLVGAVVYVRAAAIDRKVFHGVDQIDWNEQIQGSINVKDNVKLGSALYVGGQKTILDDGTSIWMGDVDNGDGERNLILRAGDNPRITIDKVGNVGIGDSPGTVYGGKNVGLNIGGYSATKDIYLKDAGRWASEVGPKIYNCPIIDNSLRCSGSSTCKGLSASSTCTYNDDSGGGAGACKPITKSCTYLGTLLK